MLATAPISCAKAPASAPGGPAPHWVQGPAVGDRDLLAIDFVDAKNGWAVGDMAPTGGAVYHTADGGKSWQPIASTNEVLAAVFFVTPARGWVAGYAGRIQRTDDGGVHWATQRVEREGEIFNSIYFLDENRGWAAGASGIVLKTSNGGDTWEPVPTGREEDLWAVRFASPERGWIVGEGGLILATADGGASWAPQPSGTQRALIGLTVASPSCIVAVGDEGTVVRSDDGSAWSAAVSGTKESLNAVASSGPGALWAVGSGGTILGSVDCGRTWTPAETGSKRPLISADLFDPAHGVAVGRKGATLRLE